MPFKPKRPCSYPGCPRLTEGRFCEMHQQESEKKYNLKRGSAASRGYDSRWRMVRERHLREHPLCVLCEQEGKLTPATVVDHIKPHKGNKELFWDESNWQSLCKACHDSKTAQHDGRWG
ncbi:MAG: HNH endonuclease [Desulfitobacteriaceae bacterium]